MTATPSDLSGVDLPFLLGTAFTGNRTRAKAVGYGAHFISGQIFALIYYRAFAAIGYSSCWLSAVFRLVHGLAATALVNILRPLVHPRMGTPGTGAPDVALLERPGFLMLNYGPSTPTVTLAAPLAFGIVVAGFLTRAG